MGAVTVRDGRVPMVKVSAGVVVGLATVAETPLAATTDTRVTEPAPPTLPGRTPAG